MPLELSIPKPPDDTFLILRQCYVRICGGNTVAALLLHYFEYWHTIKIQQREKNLQENKTAQRGGDPPPHIDTLLQFHTIANLEEALMGAGKRHAIEAARKILVDLGAISLHRNPNPRYTFDSTVYYLFHPERVIELVGGRLPAPPPVVENAAGDVEKARPVVENAPTRTDNTLNNTDKEDIPRASAVPQNQQPPKESKKIAAKTPPVPPPPPRPHWQPMLDAWYKFYRDHHNGNEPNFKGRNPAYFAQLYELLRDRARKKKQEWAEDYAVKSLQYFLKLAWAGNGKDKWLQEHFILANFVEQFDIVYTWAQPKEAKTNGKPPASNEGPGVWLDYFVGRCREGQLDDRLLTDEFYDMLEMRGKVAKEGWKMHRGGKIGVLRSLIESLAKKPENAEG